MKTARGKGAAPPLDLALFVRAEEAGHVVGRDNELGPRGFVREPHRHGHVVPALHL